jgi:PAS domain S-box-containing protein
MENRQSLDQQVEVTFQRLRELLERSGASPEALETLAASLEELEARAREQVAERMAAMEALAAERTFASTVLDTVGALVVVLDREGRIVRFNRMCKQVTGYAFEEVKGRCFWDFLLTPEEVAPVRATFDNLRGGRFPNEFENYWVARDGGRRLIAWTNTAIPGPDGSPEYIIGTGLDITQRRQAEEQSRASEARARFLADVLERASQPFGAGYPDGRLSIFNAAYGDLVGYSPEEMRALNWSVELTPPEWRAIEAEHLAELQRSGQPVRYEKECIRKDGTRVPVELLVHLGRDEAGAPQYYYSFITDLTERKRAESQREAALAERERLLEENRRQRQFLEQLLETAPIGVAVVRGPEHRYEFVNAAYQAVPGIPDVPMVGRTIAEVFPGPVARGSLAEFEAVYRTGQTVSVREYEANVGPGREHTYWDSDRVPLKAPDGSVESVLIVAREVTEEVLARRQVADLAARDEAILNSLA